MQEVNAREGEKRYLVLREIRKDITSCLNFLENDSGEWENQKEESICENQIGPLLQVILDITDEELCKK